MLKLRMLQVCLLQELQMKAPLRHWQWSAARVFRAVWAMISVFMLGLGVRHHLRKTAFKFWTVLLRLDKRLQLPREWYYWFGFLWKTCRVCRDLPVQFVQLQPLCLWVELLSPWAQKRWVLCQAADFLFGNAPNHVQDVKRWSGDECFPFIDGFFPSLLALNRFLHFL